MPSHPTRAAAVVALAALALSLGACAPTSSSGAPATITVEELTGNFQPLGIEISGLPAGEMVTLTTQTTIDGAEYSSEAVFAVGSAGVVDLGAQEPEEGDWSAADAMAPFWAMSGSAEYSWEIARQWDAPFDADLVVTDAQGRALAQTSVRRPGLAPDVETRTVTDEGIVGVYSVPAPSAGEERRPAVLTFGGSEGGVGYGTTASRWLASLGYPSVGISYFGELGQPEGLENVPVETFETALGWLHAQPEVDPERVFTFGVSRGGEMALWLAAAHPDLVAGAIAPVGAGVIVCGYPTGVAWLRSGAPLVEECAPSAIGSPANQIDVTAIDGPVVLVCGTHDKVWNACDGLDDIVERRGDASDTLATRLDRAGHGSNLPPYLPMPFSADTGPSQIAATRDAQKQFWDDVIAVLERGE